MCDSQRVGKPSRCVTTTEVKSAFYPLETEIEYQLSGWVIIINGNGEYHLLAVYIGGSGPKLGNRLVLPCWQHKHCCGYFYYYWSQCIMNCRSSRGNDHVLRSWCTVWKQWSTVHWWRWYWWISVVWICQVQLQPRPMTPPWTERPLKTSWVWFTKHS